MSTRMQYVTIFITITMLYCAFGTNKIFPVPVVLSEYPKILMLLMVEGIDFCLGMILRSVKYLNTGDVHRLYMGISECERIISTVNGIMLSTLTGVYAFVCTCVHTRQNLRTCVRVLSLQ